MNTKKLLLWRWDENISRIARHRRILKIWRKLDKDTDQVVAVLRRIQYTAANPFTINAAKSDIRWFKKKVRALEAKPPPKPKPPPIKKELPVKELRKKAEQVKSRIVKTLREAQGWAVTVKRWDKREEGPGKVIEVQGRQDAELYYVKHDYFCRFYIDYQDGLSFRFLVTEVEVKHIPFMGDVEESDLLIEERHPETGEQLVNIAQEIKDQDYLVQSMKEGYLDPVKFGFGTQEAEQITETWDLIPFWSEEAIHERDLASLGSKNKWSGKVFKHESWSFEKAIEQAFGEEEVEQKTELPEEEHYYRARMEALGMVRVGDKVTAAIGGKIRGGKVKKVYDNGDVDFEWTAEGETHRERIPKESYQLSADYNDPAKRQDLEPIRVYL